MKIGILSDTHNHRHNTQIALETLQAQHIQQVIHCGDITSPEIIHLFAGWDVTFVFGNMDSNQADLIEAAKHIGVAPPQRIREIEVNSVRIGVTHGDDASLLFRMMSSGNYAYICHGHTHQRRDEQYSTYGVRLINPGALGGEKSQTRSIGILDVVAGELEFVEFATLA